METLIAIIVIALVCSWCENDRHGNHVESYDHDYYRIREEARDRRRIIWHEICDGATKGEFEGSIRSLIYSIYMNLNMNDDYTRYCIFCGKRTGHELLENLIDCDSCGESMLAEESFTLAEVKIKIWKMELMKRAVKCDKILARLN